MANKKLAKPKKLDLGVLLEEMDKKFDLVFEGHAALDKKFDKKIDEFRYETRTETGFLKLGQSVTNNKLKDLAIKVDSMDEKYDKNFKGIMEYLSRIDDEIQELKKIFAGRPEPKRLLAFEERLAHVELAVKKFYGKNQ